MQLGLENLTWRQLRSVLGHPNAAPVTLKQLDVLFGLVRAQDEPDRRLFTGTLLVLLQP